MQVATTVFSFICQSEMHLSVLSVVPGKGNTDATFIVRQQQKYIATNKLLRSAFV